MIQCVSHLKHRTVLLTLYAAGLRLAEATNLKVRDIDSQRMQLKINGGKGGKDRYVPISQRLLEELRAYWKIDRPSNYLFPGKTPDVPLSGATIQRACKMAAALARINKNVTPHTMRHYSWKRPVARSYTLGSLSLYERKSYKTIQAILVRDAKR